MFRIEDELHAEPQAGEFPSFEGALAELRNRATLPWDKLPNVAPCTSWRTCGRLYEIVEYDDAELPWKELGRTQVLEINAQGLRWLHTVA